ncbi:hypothetical protein PR254_01100 [Metamycoplasma hyosynoviae]|uniref:hypothetical protein n=2 Tax=Metamycoplasma hyosynoviae TaxID=29559 RepID=UPI00235885F4|nr:hypothetical protein [Metamycoplasma hyosynoviae]MDC8927047.1 hypothetical protein [Metamycoplasma hyosynoviae]MDD1371862.1 hypothetical protein [Metamycoplasma hyosynoviae]MDD7912604.1 hypothetical protein [Metamycoplasma hyosynoviae]
MNLFIETCLDDLYLIVFKNNGKIISKIKLNDITKKTDVFFENLNYVLNEAKIQINEVNKIYVTKGPGSFNGSRIGFLFARTIAQISDIELFTIPTYVIFYVQHLLMAYPKEIINIKANKHSIYKITLSDNLKKINMELIANENNYEKLNYSLFEKNIFTYLNFSKKVEKENLLKEELIYLSNPQIGELKW